MSPLDPPAAAARRQYVLDRYVEDLIGWGCPLDTARDRARQLLEHVLVAGYTLPTALQPPPAAGGGSTPEGRAAARAAFEAARRQGREGAQQPAGKDQQPHGYPSDPPPGPAAHRGTERVVVCELCLPGDPCKTHSGR